MNWYYMRGPGGTICCKGSHKAEAIMEAAERWGCDPAEIEVTNTEPYSGNGAPMCAAAGRQIIGATEEKAASDAATSEAVGALS